MTRAGWISALVAGIIGGNLTVVLRLLWQRLAARRRAIAEAERLERVRVAVFQRADELGARFPVEPLSPTHHADHGE